MSYFDSPKNRAIWEKRMVVLRAERERREANGFRPVEKEDPLKSRENPEDAFRRKISMEELQNKIAAQGIRRVRRPGRGPEKSMEMSKDKTKDVPVRKAMDKGAKNV